MANNKNTKGQDYSHQSIDLSQNLVPLKVPQRNTSAKDSVSAMESKMKAPKKSQQGI